MLKRHSGGHELGEMVNTARNTTVNPDSVAQFDFHQYDFGCHQLNDTLVTRNTLQMLDSSLCASNCFLHISGMLYFVTMLSLIRLARPYIRAAVPTIQLPSNHLQELVWKILSDTVSLPQVSHHAFSLLAF
jgi:hypothetical protein